MLINTLLFLLGLAILLLSSDWLIQGCVKISYLFKLTPLFIGLVLVAFGTSAPEAGVGIIAAVRNEKSIALGNIVGSNIANIGLILGLCALLRPLAVDKNIFKRELPMMIFSVFLLYVLSLDLTISRIDGLIFLLFFIIFFFSSYRGAKKAYNSKELIDFKFHRFVAKSNSKPIIVGATLLSLLGIIGGANLMVNSGVNLAKMWGVSTWVIGITIFAIGTSLPELAASVTASLKKVPSISIGNIVGSNIFNILFVLGVVSLIRPIEIQKKFLTFEYVALVIFSAFLLIAMKTGYKISRKEAIFMFVGYIIFIGLLFCC